MVTHHKEKYNLVDHQLIDVQQLEEGIRDMAIYSTCRFSSTFFLTETYNIGFVSTIHFECGLCEKDKLIVECNYFKELKAKGN